MIHLRNLLFLFPLAFCTSGMIPSPVTEGINSSGKGIRLEYNGALTTPQRYMIIGVTVEIDPSIGAKYEVKFLNGDSTSMVSHIAYFYKISDPNKTIYYNFLTHKSKVINNSGSSGSSTSKVNVVGTDKIGSYSCTHLQSKGDHQQGVNDYWVSTKIPGYTTFLKMLNNISPGAEQSFIDGNILQWGGLVKMTASFGGRDYAHLDLFKTNSSLSFPADEFNAPSH
ncbi:MAG: DUF4412 domain-containing protein [Bacteroidetes bacterium]|nr:DUF4412 domain-containing protein [Bacteroidota bacterium]